MKMAEDNNETLAVFIGMRNIISCVDWFKKSST